MANTLYLGYRRNLLGNATFVRANILSDTVRAVFVDHADINIDPATHDAYNDITAAGRITGTTTGGPALTGRTDTGGTFDAADTTFASVSGDQPDSLTLYKDTGSESTSLLLVFFDTPSGNFPVPNGGDILVTWSGSGILSL